jgi:hypothetical protein
LRRRRSPKRGLTLDLFDELVHISALVADPNFRVEIPLIREEEIRGPIPETARYRYPREWWRLERRLIGVMETIRIDTPADLLSLLPEGSARAVHDGRHRRRHRPVEAARNACGLLPRTIGRGHPAGSPWSTRRLWAWAGIPSGIQNGVHDITCRP